MKELLDRILIVEDEPLIAEDISDTLDNAGYGVAGIAHNAKDALEIMDNHSPSLVLLDVNIDGAVDGLELADLINKEYELPFIFLTSYTDNKTLERIAALNAEGYINKPFNDQALTTNIALAISRHKANSQHLAKIDETTNEPKSLFVKKGNNLIRISTDDIKYAQSFDNYTYLVTDKDRILVPHTLKRVAERLSSSNFFRIHRSYVVNLDRVDEISDNHVKLKTQELPLSRSYRIQIRKAIELL
jgi:DNA-binding LytR/AlgR family response regulator